MKIVDKKMSKAEQYELFLVMFDAIEGAVDANSKHLEFNDYFITLEHFYDKDNNFIGIGISSEYSQFVLNDETREDFVKAFREARDFAIEKSEEL